jgi:hypothetical protein
MPRALPLALLVALSGCASSASSAAPGSTKSELCAQADEARQRWQAAFDAARACDPDVANSCSEAGFVTELCNCNVPANADAALRAAAQSARDEALNAAIACAAPAGLSCSPGCQGGVRGTICTRTGPTTGICTFAP